MKNKTELPVTIYTGYEHETAAQNHRQQIEKAMFYLQSVFSLLKRAARDFESETSGNYEKQVFAADIEHLSEIGFGIAGSIFKPVNELEGEGEPLSLAEQIAALLENEDIPFELHDAIMDALDRLGAMTKHKSLTRVEKSADFIESVLRDYRETKSE